MFFADMENKDDLFNQKKRREWISIVQKNGYKQFAGLIKETVYFPASSIWAGLVTCSDKLDMGKVTCDFKQDLELLCSFYSCPHGTLKPPCKEAQARTGGDWDPADNPDMNWAI